MDLKEFDNTHTRRHPWETARLKALATILRPHLFNAIKVLDVGCGDGFISTGLFSYLTAKSEQTVRDLAIAEVRQKGQLCSGLLHRLDGNGQPHAMKDIEKTGQFRVATFGKHLVKTLAFYV